MNSSELENYPHVRRAVREFPEFSGNDHPLRRLLSQESNAPGLAVADRYLGVLYRLKPSHGATAARKIKDFCRIPEGKPPKRWEALSQAYSEAKVCWLLEDQFGFEVVDLEAPSPKRAPGCGKTCDFTAAKGNSEAFVEVKLRAANFTRMYRAEADTAEEQQLFDKGEIQEFRPGTIEEFRKWLTRKLCDASRIGADLLAVSVTKLDVIPCESAAQVAQDCFGVPCGLASASAEIQIPHAVSGVLLVRPARDTALVLNPHGDEAVLRAFGNL